MRSYLFKIVCIIFISSLTTVSQAETEVMTLNEAAKFLKFNPTELEKLAQDKAIPARHIGTQWRFSHALLLEWLKGDDSQNAKQQAKSDLNSENLANQDKKITSAQNEKSTQKISELTSNKPSDKKTSENKSTQPIGENSNQKTSEDVFLRDQGVLLKRNQVTVETDLYYSKFEQGGLFGLNSTDTFTSNYSVRYGLWDDLQFSASIPLYHRMNSVATLQSPEKTTDTLWGDAAFTLRQVILKENVGYPTVIFSLEGHIPTSHNNYAIGGGVSLTKSIDPAVLFANFRYLHSFSEKNTNATSEINSDTTLYSQIDNIFDGTVGIAYALNDTLTLSTAISGRVTHFANSSTPSVEKYDLQLGLTSLITDNLFIEPTVSFGLNDASSKNVSFGINIPYTF